MLSLCHYLNAKKDLSFRIIALALSKNFLSKKDLAVRSLRFISSDRRERGAKRQQQPKDHMGIKKLTYKQRVLLINLAVRDKDKELLVRVKKGIMTTLEAKSLIYNLAYKGR